jgi:hypothetical protein
MRFAANMLGLTGLFLGYRDEFVTFISWKSHIPNPDK